MADAVKMPRPFTATEERIAKPIIRVMSLVNTWIYRWSGGRFGAVWMHGAPILLLTTVGRKSGERRTAPLLYLEDGPRVVVVGSQGGMAKDPLWVKNIDANPDVEIEIGRTRRPMKARRGDAGEKSHYWPALCRMYPDYADYQARTMREIPVIILDPR
ncbi:MAG TPA: nitroreductase family deazaflavin-dependent oxidoreductase [Candidatus Limnocylindrales bacterium]|nr:nitroreductase family deazaflavin-dependent oxidoreductase [Candidatus Limnocylindrales bacterium]